MNSEKLCSLIQQKEGLKVDFKREVLINSSDSRIKDASYYELYKDILALINENVNTAGLSGYLIIGVDYIVLSFALALRSRGAPDNTGHRLYPIIKIS